MSYKTVLLGRYVAALESQDEPAPLSYIDLRNQESLRAWRQRCAAAAGFENRRRRRISLLNLIRADTVRW